MSSPRPITWWALRDGEIPLFGVPAMSPTLVMGEEGSTTFEITKAARAFVPLFEIRDLMVVSGGVLDIHQQILFRLESMTKVDGTLGEGVHLNR